jgi:hypothetical protein
MLFVFVFVSSVPLDTGMDGFLHLSGIRWMFLVFFCLLGLATDYEPIETSK